MIKLNRSEIFTKNVKDIQRERDGFVKSYIDSITDTEMNPQEIQARQLDIYNDIKKLPVLTIGDVRPSIITEEIHYKEAGNLIGSGFSYSLSSTKTDITQVEYIVNYGGGLDALLNTTKLRPLEFKGLVSRNEIKLHFHFQNSDPAVIGPLAKAAKDGFLDTVTANYTEVIEYFKNQEDAILVKIRTEIEQKLAENKKKVDDLNYF